MSIDWLIDTHDHLSSTQDFLRRQFQDDPDLAEGQVVCALTQSGGRGRHGRIWQSPEGNLYMSFLLRPECRLDCLGQISLAVGLSVARAIEGYVRADLKWPNDVLIEGKKCCGILVDSARIDHDRAEVIIIGLGLNVHVTGIAGGACLADYTPQAIKLDEVRDRILAIFSDVYAQWRAHGFEGIRKEWLERSYAPGTKISVKIGDEPVTGAFETIDSAGNLIMLCDKSGKRRIVTSGDVFLTD